MCSQLQICRAWAVHERHGRRLKYHLYMKEKQHSNSQLTVVADKLKSKFDRKFRRQMDMPDVRPRSWWHDNQKVQDYG